MGTNKYWIPERTKILTDACALFDNWHDINIYLKDHGVYCTSSAAEKQACLEKIPRPLMRRGGKRDHSNDQRKLFKWR